MKSKDIPLEPNKFYHIYNRGNNRENLFYNDENFTYFLRKYDEFLSGYLNTYAYCLLPNHFHLLVSVKQESKGMPSLSEQFRRFFITYSQAINKQEGRVGSLFQKPFKRIEINNNQYLLNLVFYIHANPQLHGIIDDFRKYPWSSYDRIIKGNSSELHKEVFEWFDDKENFIAYHNQKAEIAEIKHLLIE